ncbi:unnamed protein product [Cylindrotheca closterium]|uniref:NYN domain-containing protein n=1 Tax=Cylindrotheca closterium TaxID=2856 RepID=A0AAD2JPB1_9STRA|nr:unnamed protein product [Cylindrotheca closterium]
MQSCAVLVDVENVSHKSLQWIMPILDSMGYNAKTRKAYGDFRKPNLEPWNEALNKFTFEKVSVPSFASGKGTSDMAMIIGAMDIMYSRSSIGCFVLVTSDSDFAPLVGRLKQAGKELLGFGERKTSLALVKEYKNFFYVDAFKDKTIGTMVPKRKENQQLVEVPDRPPKKKNGKRKRNQGQHLTGVSNILSKKKKAKRKRSEDQPVAQVSDVLKKKKEAKRKRSEAQHLAEVPDLCKTNKKQKIVSKCKEEQHLVKVLVDVVKQKSNRDGWANLRSVGRHFDCKRRGCSKLGKLIKRNRIHFLSDGKRVRVRVQGLMPDDELD